MNSLLLFTVQTLTASGLAISKSKDARDGGLLGTGKHEKKYHADAMDFNAYNDRIEKKLKDVGFDRAILEKGSVKKSELEWKKQLAEIEKKTSHNKRHMTPHKALEELKTRIHPDAKEELTALLQHSSEYEKTGVVTLDDKKQFVRAMSTLNAMYLSIDAERIDTLTTCTVELFSMYRKLYYHFDAVHALENLMGIAFEKKIQAQMRQETAYKKLAGHQEQFAISMAERETVMASKKADLVKAEEDVKLFKHILKHIGKQCVESQTGSSVSLSQKAFLDMNAVEKEKCMKHHEATCNSRVTTNKALLKIFSDPEVVAAAEKDLSVHAKLSLSEIERNLEENEKEVVSSKYQSVSFLQKDAHDGDGGGPQPWVINGQSHCGCGSLAEAGCGQLLTIVGQELECRKQVEREKRALYNEQQTLKKKETDDSEKIVTGFNTQLEMEGSAIGEAQNEAREYQGMIWDEYMQIWDFYHHTTTQRMKCYMDLSALESNSFCAIKHIRDYMKKLTLKALKLEEDDVIDCKYSDFMKETGLCEDKSGKPSNCIQGDKLPAPEDLPMSEWTRDAITDRTENTTKIADRLHGDSEGVEIALQCPENKSKFLKCNDFLCPTDCKMTGWKGWSKCTALCGSGFRARTREIEDHPRNGGAQCEHTHEVQECEDQACDQDCVLHDWKTEKIGCLQACTTNSEESRFMLERREKIEEPTGKGTCEDKDQWEDRVRKIDCPAHECDGDEVCMDNMDLVIAYECSMDVTQLGCWMMASFVVSLLEKMPNAVYLAPTMKIGLVKFGNGKSLPSTTENGKFVVQNAEAIMSPYGSGQFWDSSMSLMGHLMQDAMKLWYVGHDMMMGNKPGSSDSINQAFGYDHWELGYNNLGQALNVAGEMLDNSERKEEEGLVQKILVLTKGKNVHCTVANEVADTLKKKGVFIDIALFSPEQDESAVASNPSYDALEKIVSFPPEAHLKSLGSLHTITSWTARQKSAESLIPRICPGAVSPIHAIRKLNQLHVLLLHRDRTCDDWNYPLSPEVVSLSTCANLATEAGFQGFLYTEMDDEAHSGSTEDNVNEAATANCLTHETDGKKAQFKEDQYKTPSDDTCNAVPDFAKKKKPDEFKTWLRDDLRLSRGTSHYAVITSSDAPSSTNWMYKSFVFSINGASSNSGSGY